MEQVLIDSDGMWFMACYFMLLIALGVAGRVYSKENSLADFYLGGRNMGFMVLFLTLYATQYSGNTLIGFAGRAYRQGFLFLVSVTCMIAVTAAFMVYAPRLHALSKRFRFITPSDFIQQRFASPGLSMTVSIFSIIALANYILSNLKAMGYVLSAVTGGAVGFAEGIVWLSLIMVVYESLGGMRSVAWSDTIQGLLLLAGCVVIFIAINSSYGGLAAIGAQLADIRPDFFIAPGIAEQAAWLSTLVLLGIGISVYPHAIQRMYAARDATTLRRSLQLMALMPLVTTLFMVIVGIAGNVRFPGLDQAGSEQITLLVLGDLAGGDSGLGFLIVLFIAAAVAAIMSTVDSALLSISSLFTQDLYRRWKPASSETQLTRVGKLVSWLIMAAMAWLAINLPQTIWQLVEIKLEILCQIAPAIYFGVHSTRLGSRAVHGGLWAGTALTLLLMLLAANGVVAVKPLHIHAGVWGLGLNLLVLAILHRRATRTTAGSRIYRPDAHAAA